MAHKFVASIRQCEFPPLEVARQRRPLTVSNSERNPCYAPPAILSYELHPLVFSPVDPLLTLPVRPLLPPSSSPLCLPAVFVRPTLRSLPPTIFTQLTYGFDFIARIEFPTPGTRRSPDAIVSAAMKRIKRNARNTGDLRLPTTA